MSTKQDEAQYVLVAEWRGCDAVVKNGMVALEPIPERQGEVKPVIHKVKGNYAEVAKEATRRNNIQQASGFLDWLFSPDLIKVGK